jgi:hypothetical protein
MKTTPSTNSSVRPESHHLPTLATCASSNVYPDNGDSKMTTGSTTTRKHQQRQPYGVTGFMVFPRFQQSSSSL